MKVKGPDMPVMAGLVVLGRVVSEVFQPRVPKNPEAPPLYLITCPKISHFQRPQLLPLDGAINDAHGGGVVDVDGGGRLWVAELLQREAEDAPFLHVQK